MIDTINGLFVGTFHHHLGITDRAEPTLDFLFVLIKQWPSSVHPVRGELGSTSKDSAAGSHLRIQGEPAVLDKVIFVPID
jgi:hypothetical protein